MGDEFSKSVINANDNGELLYCTKPLPQIHSNLLEDSLC